MSRPRVLCVSGDRETRATVTLSLTDAPVEVVIARAIPEAIDHLERKPIDAVVIDATTIPDVSAVVDAVERRAPECPAFVYWGGGTDDSVAVLSEVVAQTDRQGSSERLAAAITDRFLTGSDGALQSGSDLHTTARVSEPTVGDVPDDLETVLDGIKRRLVDARSPNAVERTLREECTAIDRFEFAWIGELDRGEREIVPWLTNAETMGWPLQRTFPVGNGTQPLIERALESRAVRVVQDIESNRELVPLADHALECGAQSIAVAPLASAEQLYGVFVVYGSGRLSADSQETIRSIAHTVSAVLETIAVRGRLEQRERALDRYERLVETAGDGMYVLDTYGHFTTVNDALVEMTGYAREGMLGEHAKLMLSEPTDVETCNDAIETLLKRGEQTGTVELTIETKAGNQIPSEAKISVLVRNGEFLGTIGVVRDITERKRRERTLREQNERLDAFAKIVSHDLRNPLGVSRGYLDLIEKTGSLEHIEKVDRGLDRMESIVDDVLAIAQDGEWVTETEPVDLGSVAQDAWDHVSSDEATLTVGSLPTVDADESRLLRLLENLFRNAIEHGGLDVTIRIDTLERKEGFYVEDDGVGFPEEMSETLFDPSVSASAGGLGIGLWIVREVATGHGWSVTASESENGGARFEFVIGDQSPSRS